MWPTQPARDAAIKFARASDKERLSKDATWLAALCQALGQSGRGKPKELRARIDVQAHKYMETRK